MASGTSTTILRRGLYRSIRPISDVLPFPVSSGGVGGAKALLLPLDEYRAKSVRDKTAVLIREQIPGRVALRGPALEQQDRSVGIPCPPWSSGGCCISPDDPNLAVVWPVDG